MCIYSRLVEYKNGLVLIGVDGSVNIERYRKEALKVRHNIGNTSESSLDINGCIYLWI